MMTIDEIIAMGNRRNESEKEYARFAHYQKYGYDKDGVTYLILDPINCEEDRDRLVRDGARYDKILGYHAEKPLEGHACLPVKLDDIAEYDAGEWHTRRYKVLNIREKAYIARLDRSKPVSKAVGAVGDVVSFDGTFTNLMPTNFENKRYCIGGLRYANSYEFTDGDGNKYTYTTPWYDPEKSKAFLMGKRLRITGTVAKHYKHYGAVSTALTRVSVEDADGNDWKAVARYAVSDDAEKNSRYCELAEENANEVTKRLLRMSKRHLEQAKVA